jgi:ankyrin repeat protein
MSSSQPFTNEDHLEFLECARYGEEEDVKFLLGDGANINFQDSNGNTALHKACANGHLNVVTLLMSNNALFLPNTNGNTPLHWAALNGHLAVVNALITHYSDSIQVLKKNSFGKSALTEAISNGHEEIAREILKHFSADPSYQESESSGPNGEGFQEEEGDDDENDDAEGGAEDTAAGLN